MTTSIREAGFMEEAAATAPVARLRPRSGWVSVDWREIWEYRELLWFLAVRDIKVRYKQTALGVVWAVIQPLMTILVFTVFLHYFAGIGSKDHLYPVQTLCALLPWNLFAYALTQSSNSLVANQQLLTKLYFPRLIIPLSSVLSGLVDFGIGLAILAVMMACFGVIPPLAALTLPLFVGLSLLAALAIGLWLSALNVLYRDVRYLVPFMTQIWFYASPIAYPIDIIPEKWRVLYGLNPMVGVVEGFRWALLDQGTAPGAMLWVSLAVIALLFVSGLFYFRRMERHFADIV
jgi:lipopolysaccharide transport system permease protein